jgi:hypothetical protein
MAITEKQVHEAASAIDRDGKRPSAPLIRERLGGGSFSTILKYLATWEPDTATEGEPDKIPDAPAELLAGLWRRAYVDAWRILEPELVGMREAMEEAQGEAALLADSADQEAAKAAAYLAQAHTLAGELEAARLQVAELQGELKALRSAAVKPARAPRAMAAKSPKPSSPDGAAN